MDTIISALIIHNYQFYFYKDDDKTFPTIYVTISSVENTEKLAAFDLHNSRYVLSHGFTPLEISEIQSLVIKNKSSLSETWIANQKH